LTCGVASRGDTLDWLAHVVYRSFHRVDRLDEAEEITMKGYVVRRRNRYYAVIYEGLDPVTGRDRRSWHPAGTDRADAERLAARLAAEHTGTDDEVRSLSFGAYLTRRWLPAKRLELKDGTWAGYAGKVRLHIAPALGTVPLRRLRPQQLEALYDRMLHPTDGGRAYTPKMVLEVHQIIRRSLADAVERGLLTRNVALVAHAPKLRAIPTVEHDAWDAEQLHAFLGAAAGHRHFAFLWVAAFTGMRRSELVGLQWRDIDFEHAAVSVTRGLVSVGYELKISPGKTPRARRRIDLDPTTVGILRAWKEWQAVEQAAAGADPQPGWVFAEPDGHPVHPHSVAQACDRIAARAGLPQIHLHGLRHTHATLLIKAGVPVKVVSERLGHSTTAFTIETYQHVLPGMQAEAAHIFETLVALAVPPGTRSTGPTRRNARRNAA
jgi:integrase